MDWINSISNMDNTIYDICIKESCLIIYIKTWDQKIKQIIFSDYYAFKEKNSIGREIGDILIQTNSTLLEELKEGQKHNLLRFVESNNSFGGFRRKHRIYLVITKK